MNVDPVSEEYLFQLLNSARTVAIVGASDNPARASYMVAQYLKLHSHFKIYCVNPRLESLFGEKVYPTLASIPEHIDIVDVFRKAEDCLEILNEGIEVGADAIWLQLGISVLAVKERAITAGLEVVMDRCIKIDYQTFRGKFDFQK